MIKEEDFNNIEEQIKLMSNKQLATLNFLCWSEATNRAAIETEKELEQLVDSVVGKR